MEDAFTQLCESYRFLPGGQNWVRPAYNGYSIINVMSSLLAHFGVEYGQPLAFHDDFLARLAGKRKIVFLFLDGLGWLNLHRVGERSAAVRDFLSAATLWPITTVSPSTTSTASVSFITAQPPAEHGVLGFLMYFPEYQRVFNMLGFRSPDPAHVDLLSCGFNPESSIPHPTILERLDSAGIMVGAYTYAAYAGSGLSRILYANQLPYPYLALGDLLYLVSEQLGVDAPQFQFMYWSTLDSIAHMYGAYTDAYANELAMLLTTLRNEFLTRIGDDTALVICADHGHIDRRDNEATNFAWMPELLDLFRVPPSGEGRQTQLFIKPGEIDRARAILEQLGHVLIMTQEEFLATGLLGNPPLCDGIIERLGDLVVFPFGTRRTLFPYEPRPHTAMTGRHGGLSPDEMVVPLLLYP